MNLPIPTEHEEQAALFEWAEYAQNQYPELWLLHAIPNGGFRSKKTAVCLKTEGLKPGVPDMCLPVARQGFHGLYIELKRTKGGKVSGEQTLWIKELAAQGYLAVVCKGWIEAKTTIEEYLRRQRQNGD